MSVTVKFGPQTHTAPAGTCLDIKLFLSGVVAGNLQPCEQRLLGKGKVLKDDDVVAPNTKLMLSRIHGAAVAQQVRLNLREIVSGRVPRSPVLVQPSTPHAELVEAVVKALRLPPCDEYTEVRLYLPHLGSLMRPDLTLADYPVPEASKGLEIYAVPCPIAQKPEELAARAQAAHAMSMRNGGHRAPTAYVDADDEAQAEPDGVADSRRALAGLMDEREQLLEELASHAESAAMSAEEAEALRAMLDGMGSGASGTAPFNLPPSLADAIERGISSGSEGGASRRKATTTAAAAASTKEEEEEEEEAEEATAAAAARKSAEQAAALEAMGVPSRLRTGLMPSIQEPVSSEEIVQLVEVPEELLVGGGLEYAGVEYELSCMPPSLGEWEQYCAHEEERLEERCADLVSSLAPVLPPSPRTVSASRSFRRPPAAGTDASPPSAASSSLERVRRSRSPGAAEHRRRHRRSRLDAALALAADSTDAVGDPLLPSSRTASSSSTSTFSSSDGAEGSGALLNGDGASCGACTDDCTDEADSEGDEHLSDSLPPIEHVSSTSSSCSVSVGPPTSAPSPNPMAPKKVKGSACKQCNCRLPLTACASACKCGEIFCAACMPASCHACPIDYKGMHIKKLRDDNPKLGSQRLERF